MSWAGSIYEAFAYQLLSGFGIALYSVARHAYITEHAPIRNRGKSMALFGGLNRVGGFIGPLIGGYVADATGLRVPFVAAALIVLPAMASVALTMPDDVRKGRAKIATDAATHTPAAAPRGRLRTVLRGQAALLVPAGLGHIFVQMVRSGRGTIIPLYAVSLS